MLHFGPDPVMSQVPFKPESVDGIIDDATGEVCALITDETTADRSRWFGPTMPLKVR